ncbi:signal peptide peptidase SppA [Rhodovibrionaceae bacterium A322]
MRVILFLLKCIVGVLATLGLVIASLIVVLVLFGKQAAELKRTETLPERMLLVLDLADGVVTEPRPLNFSSFGAATLLDQVVALENAAEDPRVDGLVVRLGSGELNQALAEELRSAVLRFRDAGKPTYGFAETFGEAGNGLLHYYLGTATDELWLQPSGMVELLGLQVTSPYFREVLDDWGIKPLAFQREEYKGAADSLMHKSMPLPVKENLQQLVDSQLASLVEGIAKRRDLTPQRARGLVNQGIVLSDEAVSEKLVDRLGYYDQLIEELDRKGLPGDWVYLDDYAKSYSAPVQEGVTPAKIAVVYGVGPVVLQSEGGAFSDQAMAANRVVPALAEAADDPDVDAIIFRVDSPGGSYVASDSIWREIERAKTLGKPVIISMGNLAASGGYFVSAPASHILAQPGTITGSIGIIFMKPEISGLLDKLGIAVDGVQAGSNADLFSSTNPMTAYQKQVINTFLDTAYSDFLNKVATGRNLTPEQTKEVAGGRIWSGRDAARVGLVDELGGFHEAMAAARELAGLPANKKLDLVTYPPQQHPVEAFLEQFMGGGLSASLRQLGVLQKLVWLLEDPAVQQLQTLSQDPRQSLVSDPVLHRLSQQTR